jgi:hypothetical protein
MSAGKPDIDWRDPQTQLLQQGVLKSLRSYKACCDDESCGNVETCLTCYYPSGCLEKPPQHKCGNSGKNPALHLIHTLVFPITYFNQQNIPKIYDPSPQPFEAYVQHALPEGYTWV